jgi:hypothetical protein
MTLPDGFALFDPFFSELSYPQDLKRLGGVGEDEEFVLDVLLARLQPFVGKIKRYAGLTPIATGGQKKAESYCLPPGLQRVSVYAAFLSGAVFFSFFFCLAANSCATALCSFSASMR